MDLTQSPEPAPGVGIKGVRALVDGAVAADAPLGLVVDDNEVNRKLLARQLGRLGLRSETAHDGRAALALWRNGQYDFVITDCHMQHLDGYELTHMIRNIEASEGRARTPIFAWTANALADEWGRCQAAGMDALLVKPAALAQLQHLLRTWLPVDAAAVPEQTPAPAPQAVAVPLDVSVLKQLVGDDPEMVRDLLRDYRASVAAIATGLRAAWAAGHVPEIGALAHKLKSSSRSVGALALGECCAELEASAGMQDRAAMAVLVRRFEDQLAAVQASLATVLDEDMGGR